MNTVKRVAGWVLHVPIAGLMIFSAWGKLFGNAADVAAVMEKYGLADSARLIGTGEALTALLLLVPRTSSLGLLLASAFWGGAICLHMSHHEPYVFQSVLLVLTWAGAYLRNPATFSSFFGAPVRHPLLSAPSKRVAA
jgi:hypothetical protein